MICFIHIERAGGTTLSYLFRSNRPMGYIALTPWFYWPDEPGAEFTLGEARVLLRVLPRVWGFGGHTTRSWLRYEEVLGRTVRYVTFVRDPVERYLSHWVYQRDAMEIPWSLDDYLAEPRFSNLMVRRIAGAEDLSEARRALAEDFAFVGLTERFDESLVLMKHTLGLDDLQLAYRSKNAGHAPRSERKSYLEDPKIRQRVVENNALDLELYAFVRDKLYPRFREGYPGDLAADTARLGEARRRLRTSRIPRLMWVGYRFAGYRPLEYLLHRWYHRGQTRRGAAPPAAPS